MLTRYLQRPRAAAHSIQHRKQGSFGSSEDLIKRKHYTPVSQLVDGLFLPPNDPRKLNKLSRKKVKDTAGKNWFDMPAQTITPELKKDLQLLKIIQELGEEYLHGKCLHQNLDRKSVVLGSRTGSERNEKGWRRKRMARVRNQRKQLLQM